MQHIYVNFKRFDVEPSFGGVNRLSSITDFGKTVATKTKEYKIGRASCRERV